MKVQGIGVIGIFGEQTKHMIIEINSHVFPVADFTSGINKFENAGISELTIRFLPHESKAYKKEIKQIYNTFNRISKLEAKRIKKQAK